MAKPDKYDNQHLLNLGMTEKQITSIFEQAVKEAAYIGVSIDDFNPDKPFSFADYPQTKARIDRIIQEIGKNTETVIVNGVRSGWTLANNKNNALCDRVFGDNKYKLTKAQERRYYSNNDKAQEAFLNRKVAGLNLSDRVWNYTGQFKTEIEMGLDLGIRNGLPAAEMVRDLKQYLKHPDKLFRRVRDEHGKLQLSTAAKEFHPGQGVYRSSYKNAMRLARTETNMAYRTADHERIQQFDFVVGIEIRLSNNHTINGVPFTDICDDLKGKYPKDFKFTGWHPQCRCFCVDVLKTPEELMQENEAILEGKEPDKHSVNEIKDVPDNFKQWVSDNRDRIEKANNKGTLPYFIKDNAQFMKAGENVPTSEYPYIMTEKHLSELRKLGFDIQQNAEKSMDDIEFAEKFNSGYMAKFNLHEFNKNLEDILKEYDLNMEIKERTLIYNEYNESYQLEYYGLIDGKKFELNRTFKYNNTVEHNLFTLPESAQGKGLSKKIFRDLYKQYNNAEIEKIEVHANLNVGGYTWAKYGFTATEKQADAVIRHCKLNEVDQKMAESIVSDFFKNNPNDKAFPMNLLTGYEWSEDLLKGSDWRGVINLKNKTQRNVFENYMYKK
ncbi:MAG: hypothetical protein LBJ72_07100 [Dysgonamonadaceae bacterium]|jgi:hypothetical protein|nr:hypothetical protein [Dysgonamonadaceae bacterium]